MSATFLKIFVLIFGIACCIIASMHIVVGPAAIIGSVPVNATMDSEDRFYATLFLAFGACLIWCSRDLPLRSRVFELLLLVFFLGGIARCISALDVGLPDHLYTGLGVVELLLPPLLWSWHRREQS